MNVSFEFEDVKIYREHPLINKSPKVFSAIAKSKGNLLIGSIVKYPEGTNMLDVHYLKKYTADNTHSAGWIKLETRRPQKGKILISRLIDRSIRPLVKDHNFQLIISLIDADLSLSPIKAALLLASDLVLQAGFTSERILPYTAIWGDCYLYLTTYRGNLIMAEGVFDNISKKGLIKHFQTALDSEEKEDVLGSSKILNSRVLYDFLPLFKELFLLKRFTVKDEIERKIESYEQEGVSVFNIINDIMDVFFKAYGRVDGRKAFERRNIQIHPYILEKPTSSVLVERGGTKVISSLVISDEPQQVDESTMPKYREFLNVQYDMLGHSVGRAGRMAAHSRREIGHGNLIFNSIKNSKIKDGTVVYIQNEVISCDGSSSMAGTLGSSINLYLTNQSEELIVGVTIGRIKDQLLLDIIGIEDWLGNNDLKLTGGKEGLTAIQLDVKGRSLKLSKVIEALEKASDTIEEIQAEIFKQVGKIEKRALPEWTVKNIQLKEPDIKYIIGFGGCNFKRAQSNFNVKINLNKDNNKLELKGESEDVEKASEFFQKVITFPVKGDILEATVMASFEDSYLIQPEEAKSGFLDKGAKNLKINSNVKVILKEALKDKVKYILAEE